MKTVKLDNWALCYASWDPYMAPELMCKVLTGTVINHPRHADGTKVTTSTVVTFDSVARTAETASGTQYMLGEPSVEYTAEMLARDAYERGH